MDGSSSLAHESPPKTGSINIPSEIGYIYVPAKTKSMYTPPKSRGRGRGKPLPEGRGEGVRPVHHAKPPQPKGWWDFTIQSKVTSPPSSG